VDWACGDESPGNAATAEAEKRRFRYGSGLRSRVVRETTKSLRVLGKTTFGGRRGSRTYRRAAQPPNGLSRIFDD